MLNQSAILTEMTPSGTAMMETIKSRFGDIVIDTEKTLVFPRGMLGMPDKFNFVLAPFPSPKMQQFMLLQSLDDLALSFITLPVDMENAIISEGDLRSAQNDLQIGEESLAILLIVSVHRGLEKITLSVNARAPIFIDAERKTGAQYVFQQDKYNVQHML